MFKVKMDDSKLLSDVLTAVSTIVDEATFTVSPKGIQLMAMDLARVAMIDFLMERTAFDTYEVDEKTKLCFSTNELLKLIKRARKGEPVEVSLDEKTGQLHISIQGGFTRSFYMPTLEVMEEEISLPKVNFNAKVTLSTDGLRQALRDAELAGDYISLEADREELRMSSAGDLMEADIKMDKDSDALLSLEVDESSEATFSLSYLSDIVKAARSTSDVVSVQFSTDNPVLLDFKPNYKGKLQYFLAPRIEK